MGGAVGWKRKRIARHESQGKEGSRQVAPAPELSQEITSVDRETQELGTAGMLLDPRLAHPANADRRAQLLRAGQRTLGNRAVQRMIQGELKVNPLTDRYEREADRVADHVIRMPTPQPTGQPEEEAEEPLQPKPFAQQVPPLVQRQVTPEEQEEEPLQPKGEVDQPQEVIPDLAGRIEALRTGGRPLPSSERDFFEPRFGYDLSQVRVHTGNDAAGIARALKSRAFTVGPDVVFGAGQYAPGNERGRKLLAHELTHTVQTGSVRRTVAAEQASRLAWRSRAKRQRVARAAARGVRPRIVARAPARRILRQAHPQATFISTHGRQVYLQNALAFHQAWGYPNIQRVDSLETLVARLVAMRRIRRVRLVTHAVPRGIFTPLFSGGTGTPSVADLRSYAGAVPRIRRPVMRNIPAVDVEFTATKERLARMHLTQANIVKDIYTRLRKNPQYYNLLGLFQINAAPAQGTDLHDFFWWVADRTFITHVRVRGRGFGQARRRAIIAELNRYIEVFRRILRRAVPAASIPTDVPRLEAAIADVLSPRAGYRWAPIRARQARRIHRAVTHAEARSVAGALLRGTFAQNLLRLKRFITGATHIEVRGCRIGQNQAYLQGLRNFFGRPRALPQISAPDWYQFFGPIKYWLIPNNRRALRHWWNRAHVCRAFRRWWRVLGRPGRPRFRNFVAFLRAGNAFPARGRIYTLRPLARDALVRWLAQHRYRLVRDAAIRQQFFGPGRRLLQALPGIYVDWLQDRRNRPRNVAFPPDPMYRRHIVP